MSIAFSQLTSRLRSVNATVAPIPWPATAAPIHWPSAAVGLVLAVFVVVGVSWLAAPHRVSRQPIPAAAQIAQAPVEAPVVVPTPIPPPPMTTPEPTPAAERVKVSFTNGLGVNLRAKAGERAARIKTMPEGSVLEVVGTDEAADGLVWRQVRDTAGTTGWVASKFVARLQP
ncbi:MAG: SH3 domain-containing protein [Chloroflexota bacterium]